MQQCADPTFGLNGQALAVLQLLAYQEPDFACFDEELRRYRVKIRTFPWYNGREKGICLALWRDFAVTGHCLLLTIAECRHSDKLFVEMWEQSETPFNCPTVEGRNQIVGDDVSERIYRQRKTFLSGRIGEAADYCYDQMSEWYKTQGTIQ